MKNKLGITEGEWIAHNKETIGVATYNPIMVVADLGLDPGITKKQQISNAKLIADAGTTANKCRKLFSGVLKERNELLEFVKVIVSRNEFSMSDYSEAGSLIQSIEKD